MEVKYEVANFLGYTERQYITSNFLGRHLNCSGLSWIEIQLVSSIIQFEALAIIFMHRFTISRMDAPLQNFIFDAKPHQNRASTMPCESKHTKNARNKQSIVIAHARKYLDILKVRCLKLKFKSLQSKTRTNPCLPPTFQYKRIMFQI